MHVHMYMYMYMYNINTLIIIIMIVYTCTCTPNFHYSFFKFIGKSETYCDMLRSIFAQLDYYQINHWDSVGVPFKDHLHVPEVHPLTGVLFCEREDEGHVFKVIITISYVLYMYI